MIVASSLPSRTGCPVIGGVAATIDSQVGAANSGASGRRTTGSPSGIPARISSQLSSLPTNSSRASLCVRICRTVPDARVGYSGTDA